MLKLGEERSSINNNCYITSRNLLTCVSKQNNIIIIIIMVRSTLACELLSDTEEMRISLRFMTVNVICSKTQKVLALQRGAMAFKLISLDLLQLQQCVPFPLCDPQFRPIMWVKATGFVRVNGATLVFLFFSRFFDTVGRFPVGPFPGFS